MDTTIVIKLDTRDPIEAKLLVDYLSSSDPERFAKASLLLGYLTATRTKTEPARAKTLEELVGHSSDQ